MSESIRDIARKLELAQREQAELTKKKTSIQGELTKMQDELKRAERDLDESEKRVEENQRRVRTLRTDIESRGKQVLKFQEDERSHTTELKKLETQVRELANQQNKK